MSTSQINKYNCTHLGIPLTQNKFYYSLVELAVASLLSACMEMNSEKTDTNKDYSIYVTHVDMLNPKIFLLRLQ